MAERIVSPGVFTREKDLSFIPQGVAEIGAAVIGTTQKGPAFWPTQVTSYTEFESKFGGLERNPTTYVPHTVREYFEQGGNVMTVVRVLSSADVTVTSPLVLKINNKLPVAAATAVTNTFLSNSKTQNVVAVLYPTEHELSTKEIDLSGSYLTPADAVLAAPALEANTPSASLQNFVLNLSGSGNIAAGTSVPAKVSGSGDGTAGAAGRLYGISASLLSSDNNSIDTVLGTSPNSNKEAYVKYYNKNFSTIDDVKSNSFTMTKAVDHVYADGYKGATTPWITNQHTGSAANNLFKLHHLGHGETTNYELKVSILNMKAANGGTDTKYPTFDLQIRTIKQTGLPFDTPYTYDATDDNSANVIEEHTGLTLDPRDANYIARRIGDRYYKINDEGKVIGVNTYPNVSRYVRVEVSNGVSTQGIPVTDAPFGYRAIEQAIPTTNDLYMPSASFVTKQEETTDVYEPGVFYGFNFDFDATDNVNYLAPIPSTANGVGTNVDFNLSNMQGHVSASDVLTGNVANAGHMISMGSQTHQLQRRFMVPFQGGQDGKHPAQVSLTGKSMGTTNTFGMDFTDSTSEGTKAYKKAINALSNADEFDINLLSMPGIITDNCPATITHAINKTEQRGDCFLIFDVAKYDDSPTQVVSTIIADAVTDAANYDSSYAGTYFPWLMYNDAVNNIVTPLPPSAIMPSVFAGNDSGGGEPWFAPAGLNRGLLTAITEATTRLTHGERDTLYEGRVNPIATFPNQGVCVWGQKTLQKKRSALDRINVRRLLIALKKFIASTSRFLVFEQNTAATRNRFLGTVNPYLESVQQRSGLHAFKVVMDDTNNTPDVVDRNKLVGNIMIQPTRTAEFIVLDFTVLPTGATFPE
jgi:phage tail sheath protein FI